jgi:hypothetical protein
MKVKTNVRAGALSLGVTIGRGGTCSGLSVPVIAVYAF